MTTDDIEAAVVEWLQQNPKYGWGEGAVPGASEFEAAQLFALGGFANPLVHPRGKSRIEGWPADVLAWTSAPEAPAELAARLRSVATDSHRVLASIYEQTVKAANRRRLGTYFTPPSLVEHMLITAERLVGGSPGIVVDPGAGVGAFSVPAVERWRTDAIAVDVNPVTLGLLGVASALRGQNVVSWTDVPARPGRRVHLVHTDYLQWITNFFLSAPRRPVTVLGNPPYTRHQSLGARQKASASDLSGDLVSSTLAGLSSYFLAVTLRHLRPVDSLVMLLPSNWLTTRYAREIRAHIWALRSRRIELHVFPTELEVFPGTQVAAVVLGVGPRRTDEQPLVAIPAHLAPNVVELAVEAEVDRSRGAPLDFSRLTHASDVQSSRSPDAKRTLLGEVVVVRRGVATGANAHYFLTDDVSDSLPRDALAPAMVRLKGFVDRDLTQAAHDLLGAAGVRRWLVDFHAYREHDRVELPAELRAYIDDLEQEDIHLRHLLAVRAVRWWIPETVSPAQLLIGPMTKGEFRIVNNRVGAIHSNTLYGLTVRDGDPVAAEHLHDWLESDEGQRRLARAARRHATGLLKLEPRAVTTVELPGWPPLAG